MDGKLNIRNVLALSDVMPSDEMKMKVTALLICSGCQVAFSPPVFGCVQGHPTCSSCQTKYAFTTRHFDKRRRFRCPVCETINCPVEMKYVNQLLKETKFVCYCGLKVNGSQLIAHQFCA